MNEWLKKFTANFKERWAKWSVVQKAIVGAIVVVIIIAIVMLTRVSSSPTTVPLFGAAITDQDALDAIMYRLDDGGVHYTETAGRIYVDDTRTARKWRSELKVEGLIPNSINPFSAFDTSNWTDTDFERNKKYQRAVTEDLERFLTDLDDIARARVTITWPEKAAFVEDQNPVKASVSLTFAGGSNAADDKKRLQGIQELILSAVDGLQAENLTILDSRTSRRLNDFEGLAESERVDIIKKQQTEIERLEKKMRDDVLAALRKNVGEDRVRDVNVKLEMDMSEVSRDQTINTPFVLKERTPGLPYDDSEIKESTVVSQQVIDKEFVGTGYNPEGPAGVEGQNPPVMSDMSNTIGKTTEKATQTNYAINTERRLTKVSPEQGRRTVSVNIDGWWEIKYGKGHVPLLNEEGTGIQREYHALSEESLENLRSLVRDAIGYSAARGDSVTVINEQFPRQEQFAAEDDAYFAKQRRNRTIMISLAGITVVLLAFIIFRFISREMERRRRLREEELLRRQQAEREKALWDARQEGMEVTMSVEERKRAELLETAIAMAKEHPEDVAMLIRTWMMEE